MTISSDIAPSLFSQIIDWSNLLLAYRKAARHKRGKTSTAAFDHQVADKLLELQGELLSGTYQPGAYVHFIIHDPKWRKISAAPFRDRVVHHAVCNLIEPLFERRFIYDSYANRVGKGTHRALDRVQHYARRFAYALRVDIRQHFASLDHAVLRMALAKTIRDAATMDLVERILASGDGVLADQYDMVYFRGDDAFALNRPRGLPIGNLTSQFWSNVYMDDFDHFVKRDLECKGFARYVDDFILFSDDKRQLWDWKGVLVERLAQMRLTIHEASAEVIPTRHGIPYLGFVVYPTHRRVKARNVVKFTRRLKARWREYKAGDISFAEFDASVQGWINHVRYGDTWGLRAHVLGQPLNRFDT